MTYEKAGAANAGRYQRDFTKILPPGEREGWWSIGDITEKLLREAELALDHPFTVEASLALDRAIVAAEALRRRRGLKSV